MSERECMKRQYMELHTGGTPDTEVSWSFFQGMIDRMGMSFYKYGRVADAYPHKVDAIASLHGRIARYAETGNREWLIDAANFAMIEFMHPRHEAAHFRATDADESPGRTSIGGAVSQTANTIDAENIRRGGSRITTAGGFYSKEGD